MRVLSLQVNVPALLAVAMETILALQLAFIPIDLIVILLCLLLPLCIVPRKTDGLSDHSVKIISLCNCFAAGVFLSTCFLLLVPTVEQKVRLVLKEFPRLNEHDSCLITQSLMLIGLFVMLLFEQVVKRFSHSSKEVKRRAAAQSNQIVSIPESSSDEETIEFDANFKTSETQKMLKMTSDGLAIKREVKIKKTLAADLHSTESHCHADHLNVVDGKFGLRGLMLFLALSLHCLLEGVAIGLQDDFWTLVNIFLAVLLHESLIAFAIGINLAQRRLTTKTIVKLSVVFALFIPAGMAVGMLAKNFQSVAGQVIAASLQGIAAGSFIFVIFLEVLPQELNSPKDPLYKLVFILFGAALIVCFKYTLPHG